MKNQSAESNKKTWKTSVSHEPTLTWKASLSSTMRMWQPFSRRWRRQQVPWSSPTALRIRTLIMLSARGAPQQSRASSPGSKIWMRLVLRDSRMNLQKLHSKVLKRLSKSYWTRSFSERKKMKKNSWEHSHHTLTHVHSKSNIPNCFRNSVLWSIVRSLSRGRWQTSCSSSTLESL